MEFLPDDHDLGLHEERHFLQLIHDQLQLTPHVGPNMVQEVLATMRGRRNEADTFSAERKKASRETKKVQDFFDFGASSDDADVLPLQRHRTLAPSSTLSLRARAFYGQYSADDAPHDALVLDHDALFAEYGPVRFGKHMKETHFYLHSEASFLNAGSYGATPKVVLAAAREYEMIEVRDPTRWRLRLPEAYDRIVAQLARFVGAEKDDVALLTNCNEGTSIVLKQFPWRAGDGLLVLSCDYEATLLATKAVQSTFGLNVSVLPVEIPFEEDQLMNRLSSHLERLSHEKQLPRLMNVCHVTSKTGYVFPVKLIADVVHSYGILLLVDGAQVPGHFPLSIRDLGADIYLGTCHKWMFSCQGVAFMALSKQLHGVFRPLAPRSRSVGSTFYGSFRDVACSSHNASAWLSLAESFAFVDRVCGGWAKVWEYNQKLASDAVRALAKVWHLEQEGVPLALQGSQIGSQGGNCLPIVPIPRSTDCTPADALKLMGFLLTRSSTTAFLVQIPFPDGRDEFQLMLAVRITAQIHLDLSDIDRLGTAIQELHGSYGTLSVIREYLPTVT